MTERIAANVSQRETFRATGASTITDSLGLRPRPLLRSEQVLIAVAGEHSNLLLLLNRAVWPAHCHPLEAGHRLSSTDCG